MDINHQCDDPSLVVSCTNVYPPQEAPDKRISSGWATHENGRICHDVWPYSFNEVERVELAAMVEGWIEQMEGRP